MQETIEQVATTIVDPMVPTIYRVASYIKENHDTFTIGITPAGTDEFDLAADRAQQNGVPGQFNMLYVFGFGEVPICISGIPGEGKLLTHTTRAVGGITKAMSALKIGDTIGVRGPFGSPWPIQQAIGKDVVIVAGGMGLAPLKPAIEALMASRYDYGKIIILFGSRSASDMVFKEDLKKWGAEPGVELHIGGVRKVIQQITFNPANTVCMVCGPDILMHYTFDVLSKRGMNGKDIYVSMERNMKCAVGFCGHCQFGPHFICKDGPVFSYQQLAGLFKKQEI